MGRRRMNVTDNMKERVNRDSAVTIKFFTSDYKAIVRAADDEGISVVEFIRRAA